MARILVADDDPLVQATLKAVLRSAGHDVVCASNGNECLAKLQRQAADLLVTDVIMPDRDGIDTIQLVRRHFPDLPIIAISGGGRTRRTDFLDVAREVGAAAVLQKPFENRQFLELVGALLAP